MPTIKTHEDIDAWTLATELKEWVFRIIKRPAVAKHFKFCDDIGRSARSALANIAEGFWRGKGRPGRPRENAKFVSYALGSLGETKHHLRDAFVEKYIEEQEYNAIIALNLRALKVCEGWCDYLMSCRDSVDTDQFRKRNARK
jgi:four helix bundle protein